MLIGLNVIFITYSKCNQSSDQSDLHICHLRDLLFLCIRNIKICSTHDFEYSINCSQLQLCFKTLEVNSPM